MAAVQMSVEDARYVELMLLGVSAQLGGASPFDDFMQRHVEFHTNEPADAAAIGERVRTIAGRLHEQLGPLQSGSG